MFHSLALFKNDGMELSEYHNACLFNYNVSGQCLNKRRLDTRDAADHVKYVTTERTDSIPSSSDIANLQSLPVSLSFLALKKAIRVLQSLT